MMFDSIFLLLALLFVKHWYVDFVDQSAEEVQYKGVYLDWRGVKHSLKHGIATVIVMLLAGVNFPSAVALGVLDLATHYHIDWIKMNYGSRDISTPQFWNHLGLDQLAHYMVYLFLVWMLV
jgi:hypothetical protein